MEPETLPQVTPLRVPEMLREGEWKEWCNRNNVVFMYTSEPPEGYSIGVVRYDEGEGHAVVCKGGKIVWNPLGYSEDSEELYTWIMMREVDICVT